jgi:hypothetical protein
VDAGGYTLESIWEFTNSILYYYVPEIEYEISNGGQRFERSLTKTYVGFNIQLVPRSRK